MQSNATTMKYYYDDANGTPVDITAHVLSINDIVTANTLERTDPYGAAMEMFTPSGKGKTSPINIGGLFKTDAGALDSLFANRVPEDPDTDTRTFTVEYAPNRTLSVETHLSSYQASPNKDNGLTRCQAVLQPTGDVTEAFPA